ncbi:MAG: hypothetical protein WC760_06415 [Bacteroidia bacterium]|jgi:hypothetical protein
MTIAQWLNDPDRKYTDGVLLFARHGGSTTTLKLFESGENRFTRTKLLQSLQDIGSKTFKPAKVTPQVIKTERTGTAVELIPIYDLKARSFKEMAALHARLEQYKTDEERFDACLKIDELDQIVDECWEKLDYYQEHGSLPPDTAQEEFQPKTIRDVVNLCKNVPTYISRINKQLKSENLSDQEIANLIKKKTAWEICLAKIESTLDGPIQV